MIVDAPGLRASDGFQCISIVQDPPETLFAKRSVRGCCAALSTAADGACDGLHPAALQGVTPTIGGLGLVHDLMRQRVLDDLAWMVGGLASPVAERGGEPVELRFIPGWTPPPSWGVLARWQLFFGGQIDDPISCHGLTRVHQWTQCLLKKRSFLGAELLCKDGFERWRPWMGRNSDEGFPRCHD